VYAERWAELLPSARVARVAGAGHMVPAEQPEALLREVEAFLGQTARSLPVSDA